MENSSVYVLFLLSDAFDVSALPAGERLKMVCKLLGVVTPGTLQFGARSRRLENLDTRQTGALKHLLHQLVESVFSVVWAGDADPEGLRRLLMLNEETTPSSIAERLAGSFRLAIGLAYALRRVDHQRGGHYHQLLSIAAKDLTYEQTKVLLVDAVPVALLTRKAQSGAAILSAISGGPSLGGSTMSMKPFPTMHAFKAARHTALECGGPGIAHEVEVHVRLCTMPAEVVAHMLQYVSENRRVLEASQTNATTNKVYALNKDPHSLYCDYLVR